MGFDYRSLEPRTSIHPVLRWIVGAIGALCLAVSAALLWMLATDTGDRDWSLLIAVAFIGAVAWGCGYIAFGRLDAKALDGPRPVGIFGRILWTVLLLLNLVPSILGLATGGPAWGPLLGLVFMAAVSAVAIYYTWRDGTPTGR